MRIKNIILTDLVSEQIKIQERIERLLNSTGNVDDEVAEIKEQLSSLVLIDGMIEKWKIMVINPPTGDNNNNNG